MATTRYSTSVTLCEDTSVNYELSDLLKQAVRAELLELFERAALSSGSRARKRP